MTSNDHSPYRHTIFLAGFGIYFFAGLIMLGFIEKGQEVFFFSDYRNPITDNFFLWITHLGDYYPYLVLCLVFIFRRILLGLVLPLLGSAVLVVSTSIKEFFMVPRPVPWFTETGRINEILLVEGAEFAVGFSFPSGHSMSAFALITFITLIFIEKKRYQLAMLLIAVLVAISRIYLVQHFLVDTLVGALIGTLLGILFAWVYLRWFAPRERSFRAIFRKK